MELDEQYPKTNRTLSARVRALLARDPHLDAKLRDDLAYAINDMADKACDLEDIFQRLLNEEHTDAELAELLIAFELTTEQIRGMSEVIDGKLYDIADRLKGIEPVPEEDEPAERPS